MTSREIKTQCSAHVPILLVILQPEAQNVFSKLSINTFARIEC